MRTTMMLMLLTTVAGAQLPELAPGSRLKLDLTDRRKVEGTLMSQTADSLVVAAEGAVITRLPASSVGRIQSTMGKSRGAGAKKGAKIGAIIGGSFGLVVGLAAYSDPDYRGAEAPILWGLVGAADGALYGVVIGAIAGSQNWKTVYERPFDVSVARPPLGGGLRFGLSVRY